MINNSFLKKIVNYYNEPPVIIIVFLWGIFLLCIGFFLKNKYSLPDLNLVGDAMGGIFGTFISTLTLIFVAYSFQLQGKSLEIQRKELEDTKKELTVQGEIFKKDNFENTFFKLIEKQQNLIEKFQWGDKNGYDALYTNENSFLYDIEFYGRKTTPPLAEYIKNYIGINEVIINYIESSFKKESEKNVYYKTLYALQSDIIRKMVLGYYIYKKDDKYIMLIEKHIPNYGKIFDALNSK